MYGGYNITEMGDITGDDVADIMIGLTDWQSQYYPTQTGAEFLYSGRSTWDSNYSTESEYNFRYQGLQYFETAGKPVGLGDVNGDYNNDFAVGSPSYDATDTTPIKEDSGCVYLCFGPVTGSANKFLNNCNVWLKSNTASAGLGNRVSPLGDINGDGKIDFIVSFLDNADIFGDRCRLYLGRSSGGWSQSAVLYSENTGDFATYAQNIGDFNGDNWDDFAISAPNYGLSGYGCPGKVYLFFGKSSGWSGNITVSDSNYCSCSVVGLGYDNLGKQMSCAGDLDGDGYDDLMISGDSEVYLVCGKGRDFCQNATIDVVADASISGFGNGVLAGIGNVNNDDYPDIAISDISASSYRGVTYVFFGGRD